MRTCLAVLGVFAAINIGSASNITESRKEKTFSLFSIVQFPNQQCTSASSSSTYGTCYTASECSSKGGTTDGNCAAGFGVCCIIYTTTCGSTVSTNTTYIRNPGYPSSYTATSAGSCSFTIKKVADDVCQLRLDFQTFSGFATTSPAGACDDTFAATGQTGSDPPSICGTNTDYHMYVEFGATATDSVTLTNTYTSTGITTSKSYNILARQISCTATWKAPTDCVQYFTGTTGSVKNYNFAGAQLLRGQIYNNCIRTELGYCAIQWKESSTTSPDPFEVGTGTAIDTTACPGALIFIPNLSPDGISEIAGLAPVVLHFQSEVCGNAFGIQASASQALVTRQQPFILGVYTDTTSTFTSPTPGFNLDYTQLPC